MNTSTAIRKENGQFQPGYSGNPGGRPKDEHKVAELARSYTVEAVETLVDLMRHSRDDRVRGTASQALLVRGWGKGDGGSGYQRRSYLYRGSSGCG